MEGVKVVQYIKRPNADTKRPHAKNISIEWLGQPQNMFFYDGCAIIAPPNSNRVFAVALETSDDEGVKIIEALVL